MHRSCFIISGIATLLYGCGGKPQQVSDLASEVRRVIPSGWTVSASNNTIHIQSTHDVSLISRVSAPIGTMEELAAHYGYQKYVVTLSFVPRLSAAEVKRLRRVRRPFQDVLDHGARNKWEYAAAQRGFRANKVPEMYTNEYSIFIERPIDRFVTVYPQSAAASVESLMASLRKVFHEY